MTHETKGQGLLETVIAIGVVVTGIIGAVSLVSFSVQSTTTTTNRIIALNLSWEAIEVAVNIRDSNFLAGDPFDFGINGGADQRAIVTFDEGSNLWTVDFAAADSFSNDTTIMYIQGGLYRQASPSPGGQATPFRRLVVFDNTSIPGAIRVVSSVQWTERGNIRVVSTERLLYDWRAP